MKLNELRAEIARNGIKLSDLAKKMNITPATLCNKMSGASEFKASELQILTDMLSLSSSDVDRIFFSRE